MVASSDYGFCCFITPQAALKDRGTENATVTARELIRNDIKPGSKNGEDNGLALILDIENFNFAYYMAPSQGLKVAVHDHRCDLLRNLFLRLY